MISSSFNIRCSPYLVWNLLPAYLPQYPWVPSCSLLWSPDSLPQGSFACWAHPARHGRGVWACTDSTRCTRGTRYLMHTGSQCSSAFLGLGSWCSTGSWRCWTGRSRTITLRFRSQWAWALPCASECFWVSSPCGWFLPYGSRRLL